jgi:hypothetical protein
MQVLSHKTNIEDQAVGEKNSVLKRRLAHPQQLR